MYLGDATHATGVIAVAGSFARNGVWSREQTKSHVTAVAIWNMIKTKQRRVLIERVEP